MRKNMKRAGAVIGTTLLTLALSSAVSGVAHADPYNCSSWRVDTWTWAAQCTGGTGAYAALALCVYVNGRDRGWDQGLPVRVGGVATVSCSGDKGWTAVDGSYTITEY